MKARPDKRYDSGDIFIFILIRTKVFMFFFSHGTILTYVRLKGTIYFSPECF